VAFCLYGCEGATWTLRTAELKLNRAIAAFVRGIAANAPLPVMWHATAADLLSALDSKKLRPTVG
jgi:hypothetical protein